MSGDTAARPRALRRVLLWGILFCITVALGISVFLLAGGYRYPLPWLVGKAIGARVELEVDRLFGGVSIPYLALYDPQAPSGAPPLLFLEDFDAAYRFRAQGGRYIGQVNIGRVGLMLDGRDPANPNYHFIQQMQGGPSTGRSPLPFLPRRLDVGQGKVSLDFPQWRLQLDGLAVSADLPSLDRVSFNIGAEPLSFAWSMPGLGLEQPHTIGALQAQFQQNGPMLGASFQAQLPGLADVDAALAAIRSVDSYALAVTVNKAELREALWGKMLAAWTPVPLRFATLDIQESKIDIMYSGQQFYPTESKVDVSLEGLVVGESGAPLYTGALRLTGEGSFEPDKPFSATAYFNQDQQIAFIFRHENRRLKADITMPKWSREEVAAVVPGAFRQYLDMAPGLRGLGAEGSLIWFDESYSVRVSAKPVLPGNAATTLEVQGGGTLDASLGALFEGRVTAKGRGGSVEGDLRYEPSGALTTQGQIQDFKPEIWWNEWMNGTLPGGLSGTLSGALSFQDSPESPPLITAALTAVEPRLQGVALSEEIPVRIDGEISLDEGVVRIKEAGLTAPNLFSVDIERSEARLATGEFRGKVHAEGDLGFLGRMTGFEEMWGEASLQAMVEMKMGGPFRADLSLRSESLGYGDWTLPYGETLVIEMPLQGDAGFKRFTTETFGVTLGEHTRAMVRRPVVQAGGSDGLSVAAQSIEIETDYGPLVSMGWLDAAEGVFQAAISEPAYSAAGMQGRLTFSTRADLLSVYGAMAVFQGLQAEGHATNSEALRAEAKMQAEELLAGGATVKNLETKAQIEDRKLRLDTNEAALFGGTIHVQAEVDLEDAAFPVRVRGQLNQVDLDVFTKEFQPPAIKMTGIASGEFDILFDRDGIRAFSAELRCPETFTINRDIVYQLAKYTHGVAILGKSLENAIGKADPRPFDSAEASISWEGGDVTVTTFVRSRLLDLAPTFYIRADWGRLLQMLRDNQLQELNDLDYSLR